MIFMEGANIETVVGELLVGQGCERCWESESICVGGYLVSGRRREQIVKCVWNDLVGF